jgi:hypothetical protein
MCDFTKDEREKFFLPHNVIIDRRNTHTETENKREGAKRERERGTPKPLFVLFERTFSFFFLPPLVRQRE